MKIPTKDAKGRENGWILTVWNELENTDYSPAQVYVTAVLPGKSKGPHLHKKRWGRFTLISGRAEIVLRSPSGLYSRQILGELHDTVIVPPEWIAEIICTSTGWEPAILINCPTPAWSADDQDEWPVVDWNPNV